MSTVPTCKKCGREHWRFVRCENVDGWRAQRDKLAERRKPDFIEQPREGFRPWGDRLTNYERTGDSLVLKDRPVQTGRNVIVPDEWGWEE